MKCLRDWPQFTCLASADQELVDHDLVEAKCSVDEYVGRIGVENLFSYIRVLRVNAGRERDKS